MPFKGWTPVLYHVQKHFVVTEVVTRVASYFWKLSNELPIDVTNQATWLPCVIVRGLTMSEAPTRNPRGSNGLPRAFGSQALPPLESILSFGNL